MELIVLPSPAEVAELAAARIAATVHLKPTAVLGLATGSSPLATYGRLAMRVQAGELDLSRVTAFALDEYVGIPKDHPESYYSVIQREVVRPLAMDPERVHLLDGGASDFEDECSRYEVAIASAGGIDIQLLGIGTNGHIGFNEPGTSFNSKTAVKELALQTRADNARFFDSLDAVPSRCLTQGIATILNAEELLLVAQGRHKAAAIGAAIEGPLTSKCPASSIRLHRNATVVIDEAAAADLSRRH